MNVIARILFSCTESGNRCGPPLLEPRASSPGGGQPAKRNSQLQWRLPPLRASGPPQPTQPPSEEAADRRACRGGAWLGHCCAVLCCACWCLLNLSCPVCVWMCAPCSPSPASNTHHGQARPGLADEVTGRGRGDGVGEVTRCQPGLPFPPPRWAGASCGRKQICGRLPPS